MPSHGPYAVGLCISWSPSDFGLSTTTQATPASESVGRAYQRYLICCLFAVLMEKATRQRSTSLNSLQFFKVERAIPSTAAGFVLKRA